MHPPKLLVVKTIHSLLCENVPPMNGIHSLVNPLNGPSGHWPKAHHQLNLLDGLHLP